MLASFSILEPGFNVELIFTPCSRCDPPFSLQNASLDHLDFLPPHNLVIWTDGSVSFPFAKKRSVVLANCSLCGAEATLNFSATSVCPSFLSAEACAAASSSLVLAIPASLPFFFPQALALSSPHCSPFFFYRKHSSTMVPKLFKSRPTFQNIHFRVPQNFACTSEYLEKSTVKTNISSRC